MIQCRRSGWKLRVTFNSVLFFDELWMHELRTPTKNRHSHIEWWRKVNIPHFHPHRPASVSLAHIHNAHTVAQEAYLFAKLITTLVLHSPVDIDNNKKICFCQTLRNVRHLAAASIILGSISSVEQSHSSSIPMNIVFFCCCIFCFCICSKALLQLPVLFVYGLYREEEKWYCFGCAWLSKYRNIVPTLDAASAKNISNSSVATTITDTNLFLVARSISTRAALNERCIQTNHSSIYANT